MKFTISSTALCNRLQTLSRVISNKNSLPILECILFELEGNQLRLTASDTDITLITEMEVNDCEGGGRFAINASKIINGIKEINEQPICIIIDNDSFAVTIQYQNGAGNFIGQSGEEYPQPKGVNASAQSIVMDGNQLLGGVTRTLFATADDELRPVMNGIFMDIQSESITFVASDGHRLVKCRNFNVQGYQPASVILPKKPAKTLKEILGKGDGEVTMRFDESSAEIKLEGYTLSCTLIEGHYPNYNSVIPTDNPYRIIVDRQALIGALRRVMVFASSSTSLVKLQIGGNTLSVSAQDIDFATNAKESVLCEYDGAPMSIGFKGTFLIEILNSLSSQEIALELADPSRAGVICPVEEGSDEDVLMLLMPMMLND